MLIYTKNPRQIVTSKSHGKFTQQIPDANPQIVVLRIKIKKETNQKFIKTFASQMIRIRRLISKAKLVESSVALFTCLKFFWLKMIESYCISGVPVEAGDRRFSPTSEPQMT